jgi:hypothetical protein
MDYLTTTKYLPHPALLSLAAGEDPFQENAYKVTLEVKSQEHIFHNECSRGFGLSRLASTPATGPLRSLCVNRWPCLVFSYNCHVVGVVLRKQTRCNMFESTIVQHCAVKVLPVTTILAMVCILPKCGRMFVGIVCNPTEAVVIFGMYLNKSMDGSDLAGMSLRLRTYPPWCV